MEKNYTAKAKEDLKKSLKSQESYQNVSRFLDRLLENDDGKKYLIDSRNDITITYSYDDVEQLSNFIDRITSRIRGRSVDVEFENNNNSNLSKDEV